MPSVQSRSIRATGLGLAFLVLSSASGASQQGGPRLDQAGLSFVPYDVGSDLVAPGAAQGAGRKEPILAGVLSWVLPGLGSFYGGNSGHGVRHLLIEVGGFGVTVAGIAAAEDKILTTGEIDAGSSGLMTAGLSVLVVNGIWSIIAAVGDANAYNRRGGGQGRSGALRLEPAPWVVPSSTSAHRVNVGLATLTF